MKTLCLYFQVHQPYRLKKYRFFNLGKDHFYFDDFLNRTVMQKVACQCYTPMNELLLKLIKENKGSFKVSFSISGPAIEQFKMYAPEVLDSFKALADTGCVEFLCETYSHSLASLLPESDEFFKQVTKHKETIKELFGKEPTVFRNTELIYSDRIGELVSQAGFKGMMTEGAKHILGWKSPNFLYANPVAQNMKLMLRNFKLSDDIAFRFSDKTWAEWPLSVDKYVSWLQNSENTGDVVNLFMDYETFGEHQKVDSGIFDFFAHLPKKILATKKMEFKTPSEVLEDYQPVALLHVPHPISWADEERDITAWLGNELQDEAFKNLYSLSDKVHEINDPDMNHVWSALQGSDHFYYMCTKWFSDGDVHSYFNPYDSPYEAFINYMNVLSDFIREVDKKHDTL